MTLYTESRAAMRAANAEIDAALDPKARARAWDARQEWFDMVIDMGWELKVFHNQTRQCRAALAGRGYIDFWPSTGRFTENYDARGRHAFTGYGQAGMMAAMIKKAAGD